MQHPDGEALAQLALAASDHADPPGHDIPAGHDIPTGYDTAADHDRALVEHVRDCPQCAADLTALTHTVDLARAEDAQRWPTPPGRVWDAIVAELGRPVAAGGSPTGSSPVADPTTGSVLAAPSTPELSAGRTSAPMPGGPAYPAAGRHAWPMPDLAGGRADSRHGRRWAVPVAAALAGMLAGGAVIWAVRSPAAASGPAPVVASAELAPVPGGPGKAPESGRAELLDGSNGPMVKVDSANLPAVAGSYEVWLLGTDGRMVSLGVLNAGVGTFTVPHGISTGDFPMVDISDEPPDGNPAHSKVSVLRGRMS